MRLMRLSKRIGRSKVLGDDGALDISWAAGPGYRGGPVDYFRLDVEAEAHDFALEFTVDEARRIKERVDDFLQHIDSGETWWETGDYFKKKKPKA